MPYILPKIKVIQYNESFFLLGANLTIGTATPYIFKSIGYNSKMNRVVQFDVNSKKVPVLAILWPVQDEPMEFVEKVHKKGLI